MVTASPAEPIRIALRPKIWLFAANLVIQPAMTALFGWMAVDSDGSVGMRIFGGLLALFTCALFVFSLLAVVRTWGKRFELLVTTDSLTVPHPVLGRVSVIPFSTLCTAQRIETRAGPTSLGRFSSRGWRAIASAARP